VFDRLPVFIGKSPLLRVVTPLGFEPRITSREDGVRKVLAGLTSAEEVISITVGDVS
jgi:hypothetical protein